jgi:hypothetical protein
MNRKENKKIAVMATVIMGFMVIAFMPLASAGVTDFTVTPSTGIAGAIDSYDVLVNTDGVTTINITIPAGFIAVAPAGRVLIAEVNFWNSTTKAYYGSATIKANKDNPTGEVDIHCKFGGDEIITTQAVSYTAGITSTFVSGFGSDTSSAIIRLPTETAEGSIKIAIDCTAFQLEDVMIAIKQFVRNPLTKGNYVFSTDDGKTAKVHIKALPGGHCTVFRNVYWYVDSNGDGIADISFRYGLAGDTPIVGDINRDGSEDTAVIRNVAGTPTWLVDTTGDRVADLFFTYGLTGDTFVVGDIDQDGLDDIAAIRNVGGQMMWFVDTTGNWVADLFKEYGLPGDSFVVGDVTRDGLDDKVAIRVNVFGKMTWCVDTTGNWLADLFKEYGLPSDKFLVGNIDMKDGSDVAVFRGRTWIVDTTGNWLANIFYNYGLVGDTPLTGDIS